MNKKAEQAEEILNEENKENIQEEKTEESTQETENSTAESAEEQTEELSEEDKLKEQLKEANDKYLRLYSDFENFRRRNNKERLDLIQSAGSDVVKEMLPILDDFERAANSNTEAKEIDAVIEGFTLIQNKLNNILKTKGLTPMATQVGDDFDVDKHEAITNIPAPSPELKGKVVDIIEKGYLFNEKVIRYAKVVVGQ
ncbi:nucleotide exchange factor GrpE [Luteibaculum oceani]|uniref:Protein GrpE n=1 Tax=Luteibaculum oceani TaxID=1294296 RepID=A0A5C6UYB3_9FLAO|nr:nucleotide exchange factor GrpE [Luteibaculum oceani]TXC78402.1 nucleotide exchange factor GrpE [Luteibaculum oceani]